MAAFDRRAVLRGAAATLALTLGAGLAAGRAAAADLAGITAKGFLRIAVYRDFQPWSWQQDGVLTGIDVDLGKAIAAKLGVKPDFLELTADEDVGDDLRNGVWRGSVVGQAPADVMLHVPFDPAFAKTQEQVAILAPYYRESFAMACGPAVDCELPPPQYKGRRLTAEIDSIPDFYLSGSFGGVLRSDVRHVPSGIAAVQALNDDGADVAMATRAQVENVLSAGSRTIKARKGPLPAMTSPGWDVGIAVKADDRALGERLAATIAALAADGTTATIFARYGVTPRAPLARA